MIIKTFPSGPLETNAYVVACSDTKQAAVIDPASESAQPIITYLKDSRLTLTKILLTHTHWDHIADVAKLKSSCPVPVYVHELDAPNLERPGADGLPLWLPIPGVHPDSFLQEGDEGQIGHMSFKVIHTPGHSPGGICLYFQDDGVLFSGDTLFKGTIGTLSLPTAQPHLMQPSLNKLADLPPPTKVLPGHGPATTIQSEPWLRKASQVFGF